MVCTTPDSAIYTSAGETAGSMNQGYISTTEIVFTESEVYIVTTGSVLLIRECMSTYIRESVDSLCRDGANAQYMQYLSKSRITSPQTC